MFGDCRLYRYLPLKVNPILEWLQKREVRAASTHCQIQNKDGKRMCQYSVSCCASSKTFPVVSLILEL